MKLHVGAKWLAVWVLAPLAGVVVAARAEESPTIPAATRGAPAFTLPALPYAQNALEPYISAKTMSFHYGKHHQAYLDALDKLVVGTPWATGQTLEKIVVETAGTADKAAIFNNAAQGWNHAFFWKSMKPGGGGAPTGKLLEMIDKSFGNFDKFRDAFATAAVGQFGSGWVWLVQEGGALKIVKTSNADTPMAHGQTALLTCDVWEHAYYLDYQNLRKDFVQAFLDHLVNWDFAASQLNGIVTLKGEVSSAAQRQLTAEHAEDIEGVREVKNERTVAATREPAKWTGGSSRDVVSILDDASITTQITTALMTYFSTRSIDARVATRNGEVTLTGIARNDAEKALVARIAKDVRGVTVVKNQMTVEHEPETR